MKHQKKVLVLALTAACICMTACSTEIQNSTDATTPVVYVPYDTMEIATTTAETFAVVESTVAAEEYAYPFVPECEVNVSEEKTLQVVTINGCEYSLDSGISLQEVLDKSDLVRSDFGTTYIESDGFTFLSGMFSLAETETDGTQISIEVMEKDGTVLAPEEMQEGAYADYRIKGIHCSNFFTKADFTVLCYGGIAPNMTEEELVSLLGEGMQTEDADDFRFYNNGIATLAVELETDTTEAGEETSVIAGITLVLN